MIFLAKFFLTYFILTLVYKGFLSSYGDDEVDLITKFEAKNSEHLLSFFNADFNHEVVEGEPFVALFYKGKYVARMIEGCNAVSIIILFISFVVSFTGKLKSTLFFIFGGSLIIYILNVVRIAMLCSLLYYFPEQELLLHDILFPLFIYGVVFILWIIWIDKFSLYAKKNTSS